TNSILETSKLRIMGGPDESSMSGLRSSKRTYRLLGWLERFSFYGGPHAASCRFATKTSSGPPNQNKRNGASRPVTFEASPQWVRVSKFTSVRLFGMLCWKTLGFGKIRETPRNG